MENRSFLKSGSKEIVLHGDLLRYKNEDEIKDIVVEKIDSISIENTKGIQSNLAWAFLGFIVSLISWYFELQRLPSYSLSRFFHSAFERPPFPLITNSAIGFI